MILVILQYNYIQYILGNTGKSISKLHKKFDGIIN